MYLANSSKRVNKFDSSSSNCFHSQYSSCFRNTSIGGKTETPRNSRDFRSPLATISNKWCLIFTIRRANIVPASIEIARRTTNIVRSGYIKKHFRSVEIFIWLADSDLAARAIASLRYLHARVYRSSRIKITETRRLKFGWKPGSITRLAVSDSPNTFKGDFQRALSPASGNVRVERHGLEKFRRNRRVYNFPSCQRRVVRVCVT